MNTAAQERRSTTIVVVDIVGYSRLVEANEDGILSAIKALRVRLIDPLIVEYNGRIVKLMGDGALMEFCSPVKAVAFAVALQKRVDQVQKRVALRRRLVFRIGINSGEVVPDGDDLLGHGVNIAARLEQLCEPGGILISGSVYDQVRGKLGVMIDFTGEQHVKNISQPIRTYRVSLDGGGPNYRLLKLPIRGAAAPVITTLLLLITGGSTLLRPLLSAAESLQMCLNLSDEASSVLLRTADTDELDSYLQGLKRHEFLFYRGLPGDEAARMHSFGRRFAFSYNELAEWLENNAKARVTLYESEVVAELERIVMQERLVDRLLQRDDARHSAVYLRAVQSGLCRLPKPGLDRGSQRPDFRQLLGELAELSPGENSATSDGVFSAIFHKLIEYMVAHPDVSEWGTARELRRLILETYAPGNGVVSKETVRSI